MNNIIKIIYFNNNNNNILSIKNQNYKMIKILLSIIL